MPAFTVRHVLGCVTAAALVMPPVWLPAQERVAPTRWEAGATPTLLKASRDLAGEHVWGIGLTLTGTWRPHALVAVEGALLGVSMPQLNFRDGASINAWIPSLSVEGHPRPGHAWDPYLSLGIGHTSFSYEEPLPGTSGDASYTFTRAGLGVRYALTRHVAWRGEVHRQFGSHGASPAFLGGVVFRFPNASVQR